MMNANPNGWRKSTHSHSNGDACVELAAAPEAVAVRDSKNPEGGHITLPRAQFRALTTALKHL